MLLYINDDLKQGDKLMSIYLKNVFRDKKFYKKLVTLAIPMIIQNFIVSSLNMFDTLMVGSLGENEIAAVGMANQYFFFYNLIIIGIATGFSIFISQYWGSENIINIKKVLGLEIISVLLIGFIFTAAALIVPEIILGIFTKDGAVIKLSTDYLTVVVLSYLITGITILLSSSLKSIGNSRIPMIISAIAIFINGILNYIFIFGKLGFPAMGVRGSALATLVARIIEMSIIIYFSFKKASPFRGKITEFLSLDTVFVKKVYNSVVPVVLNDAFWALGLVLYTVAYGKVGTKAIASVQISNTIQNLFMIFCFGISSSSLVMIGHEIGRKNKEKAIEYAKKFTIISFIIGGLLGFILIIFSPTIVDLFNVSEEVRYSTRNILIIYGVICPIRSLAIVLIAGIFRGSGDAKFALKAESFAMWVIALPLTFLGATLFKFSVEKVAMLVIIEDIVKCFLCIIHLRGDNWIHDLVNLKEVS